MVGEEEKKGWRERIDEWYKRNYILITTTLLIAFTVAVGALLAWWLSQVKIG